MVIKFVERCKKKVLVGRGEVVIGNILNSERLGIEII